MIEKNAVYRSPAIPFPKDFLPQLYVELLEMPECRSKMRLDQAKSLRVQLRVRCSLGALCVYKRTNRIPVERIYSYHPLPHWRSTVEECKFR
jgi:hypothetical protein